MAPNVIYGPILEAMALARLGRPEEAGRAVSQLLAIDPHYGDHIVSDLRARNVRADLIRLTVDGLRAAGLLGADMGIGEGFGKGLIA